MVIKYYDYATKNMLPYGPIIPIKDNKLQV